MRDLTKDCTNPEPGLRSTPRLPDPLPTRSSPRSAHPAHPDRVPGTVFREVFLLYLEPEERALYRRGGEALYTRILTSEPVQDGEPWTHARLRALARDLDFAAHYLADLAAERRLSEPIDPDETRLQAEASLWVLAARELVLAIEAAVGEPTPPEGRSDPD